MTNIVIPMAGRGSRLAKAGYKKPKPFIDILGTPMICRVLDSLKSKDAKYILIMQYDHYKSEPEVIKYIKDNYNVEFVFVKEITQGAAHTVMYAHYLIDNEDKLVIVNSDNIIDDSLDNIIDDATKSSCDGSIVCFNDNDPRWSYVALSDNGFAQKVVEKQVVSNYATAGIYYFSKGRNFVSSAINMFANNDRVNGELYVAPAYNYFIQEGGKIKIYSIAKEQFHDIGTPDNLKTYIEVLENASK